MILRQEGCTHLCCTDSGIVLDRKNFRTFWRLDFGLELGFGGAGLSCSTATDSQASAWSEGSESRLLEELMSAGPASKWYRRPWLGSVTGELTSW